MGSVSTRAFDRWYSGYSEAAEIQARRRFPMLWALAVALITSNCLTESAFPAVTVTGADADKTKLANLLSAKAGVEVTIGQNGAMAIANNGNACADLIRKAINEQTAITLNLGRDLDGVAVGRFNRSNPNDADSKSTGTQDIDLDDVEQFGADNTDGNVTGAGTVVHEMWEAIVSVKDNLGFAKAHKKAIEDYENGCFSKSNTPSVRWCDKDVVRTDPNDATKLKVYTKMKRGSDKKMGFTCTPVTVVAGQPKPKIRITAAPTFVEGDQPPPLSVAAGEETLEAFGVDPGPLYGSDCTGACCGSDQPACVAATPTLCLSAGGHYSGDGSVCSLDQAVCVPALSNWGLAVLGLLTLCAATVVIMRRRAAVST